MRRPGVLSLCALVLAGAAFSGPAAMDRPLLRVSTRARVSLAEAAEDLRRARFVFVGEAHDNREHHAAQLAVIRALHEKAVPLALGFEMFRSSAQEQLDRWVAGTLGEDDLFQTFAENWNFRWWHLYAPIFRHAREHRIPMVGLNVPQEIVEQVARRGFGSLSDAQKRRLGSLTCDVDPRYQELLAALQGIEDRASAPFQRFCQAQLVWDVAMARRLLEYAKKEPERTIVVLAGTFHSWRHGIPEQIARRSRLPSRVILPGLDEAVARSDLLAADADYVWLQPGQQTGEKGGGAR